MTADSDREIVELLAPVTRGSTKYGVGHQFEVLLRSPRTALCRDAEGRKVQIGRAKLATVRGAVVRMPLRNPTVADLTRLGLLTPASALPSA